VNFGSSWTVAPFATGHAANCCCRSVICASCNIL